MIVLGSMTLPSLYAVFDMENKKVGFAQRAGLIESNATCLSPVFCEGMQTRSSALNVCINPDCGKYYFFEFDETTSKCKLSPSFHALCGTLIAIFLIVELSINEILIFLTKRIQGIR
jgi:hypothetical protein